MPKRVWAEIVKDVGITNNGIKYIKIKHSESITTLIENVDIVGVEINEFVKRGQDIATAKEGKRVYLQMFNEDIQITNEFLELMHNRWFEK